MILRSNSRRASRKAAATGPAAPGVAQTGGPSPADRQRGKTSSGVGIVVIGRNEGERLRTSLDSVSGAARQIVYVDSGSTDGSVAMARARGVEVVEMDMRVPFRPGRARNEGFRRCLELVPDLDYVQFVDGDCEVVPGWIETGVAFLQAHPRVAVVCGRLRERHPERSIYNMLSDIEWSSQPLGETRSCGGNALMRVDAFAALGGYRPDLMGGEEPELCHRLRSAGWRVWALEDPMTLHDAAMTRFGQWWNRLLRSGYASAQLADLYGALRRFRLFRSWFGAWFWGLGVPASAIVLVPWWGNWSLSLLLLYPAQLLRLALSGQHSTRENWWNAAFAVLGAFPRMLGQSKYQVDRLLSRQPRLIAYK